MDWFKDCFPGTPPIKHAVLLQQGPHQIPGLVNPSDAVTEIAG